MANNLTVKQLPGSKLKFHMNGTMNTYFKFLLVSLMMQEISGEYGPSILSLVKPMDPSSEEISFLHIPNQVRQRHYESQILYLADFPNYAAVLPLAEGKAWIKSEEIISILGKDFLNNAVPFIVVPPPGYGIMAVIQELQIPAYNTFNRTVLVIDDSGFIMECFSKFVFKIEGKHPVQVCGRTNDPVRRRPSILDGVGPRSFIVPEGRSLAVNFIYKDEQIDKDEKLAKHVPFYDFGFPFGGSIAFTAYKSCPRGPPYYDNLNAKLWPCDIPQNNQEPVAACVREELFCDNVINCGIHNSHEFGIDERFCKTWESPDDATISNNSQQITLDPQRLEKAIHSRLINNGRPMGYKEVTLQFGVHSSHPTPELSSSDYYYPTETIEADYTHPAFVTLVILISIISVLIVGLLFRLCCKRCIGKSDPFAESSNPEALARFHENLRNRDNEGIGRPASGYGLSTDTLFKTASDDLPPSYEDLFPQEVRSDKVVDNGGGDSDNHNSSLPTSNSNTSNNTIVILRGIPAIRNDYPSPSSIYTIPVVQQSPSSSITIPETDRHSLKPSSLLQVEVISASGSSQTELRDTGGGVLAVINNCSNNVSSSSNNQTHVYPDQHHNVADNYV